MGSLLVPLFALLFLATLVGSFWGGVTAAQRLVSNPVGSVLLGILFGAVFFISGCIALVAGCAVVNGAVNFH